MPQNRFEQITFAVLTVIVTVHAYVFYSLYVVNGWTLMTVNSATAFCPRSTHKMAFTFSETSYRYGRW